jgi:hypothetical protein
MAGGTEGLSDVREKARALSRSAGGPVLSIHVLEQPEALAQHFAEWADLASAAIEPNPFYEPWLVIPALKLFDAGDLLFVLVFGYQPGDPPGPTVLCGFFPLARRRGVSGLPVKMLGLWRHDYCFLCTPLLRSGWERETLSAFFDWLEDDPRSCGLMEFGLVNGEGPFHHLLVDFFNERTKLTFTSYCYTRAFFQPRGDPEAYLRAALAAKRRHELRRQERLLSELGGIEYVEVQPGPEMQAWIENFMRLEASGWKAQHGTAFASQPSHRAFFEEIAARAVDCGRLMMLELRCGGRPIASKCNFITPPGSFAFKIGFDAEYYRFSPGVMLELENMRRVVARPDLQWMDSCAAANHFMLNRLWTERRSIQTVVMATGRRPGELVVSMLPAARWLKRKVRRTEPEAHLCRHPPGGSEAGSGATPARP